MHPADELVPTYDAIETPIVVEKGEVQGDHPLSAYIADTQDAFRSVSGTGIFVERPSTVEISRLDDDRFLVLDERNFELLLFSEATDHTDTVATNGGDPGNVANASGLDAFGDAVYVSTRDYRIETYDCAEECTYVDTRSLEFSPYDVAVFGERVLAPGFTYDPDTDGAGLLDEIVQVIRGEEVHDANVPPSELFQEVVRVFDLEGRKANVLEEGSEILAFGSAYDSQVYRFNLCFMNNARLAYSTDAGRYALTYTPFPYLYVYNKEGQLTANYRFDDDIEPAVEYRQASGRSKYNWLERDPQRSYFLIAEIESLALVLRESIEAANGEEDDSAYTYDYYVVDLQNDEVYHVGTNAYVGQHAKMIYPTEAGLVLNEGGALYFIEK